MMGQMENCCKHVYAESSIISYSSWGFTNMSFGGRLMNAMYNLAYNIQYYLTHKVLKTASDITDNEI